MKRSCSRTAISLTLTTLVVLAVPPNTVSAQVRSQASPAFQGRTAPPPPPAAPGGLAPNPQPAQPAPGGFAQTPTTGVCSAGFSKVSDSKGLAGGQEVYSVYTCQGDAPKCPVQRAAAEKPPALDSALRESPGGADASGPFTVRVSYKAAYDYSCTTPPLQCLSKALNGNANYVNLEVRRAFLGDKIEYKCSYIWNQG